MSTLELVLLAAGAVTSVGDDAVSTCAAMRAGFNHHHETGFTDQDGQPVIAARAALDPALWGEQRLIALSVRAIAEAQGQHPLARHPDVPWILCTPEVDRTGRPADDHALLERIAASLGRPLPDHSLCIAAGRTAGLLALATAQELIHGHGITAVLVIAVDSLIDADLLAELDHAGTLLTEENPHGHIPGEAAVALLIAPPPVPAGGAAAAPPHIAFDAVAFALTDTAALPEPVRKGERPAPIDGQELALAMQEACRNAGCATQDIGLRIADTNGTDTAFKESALAEALTFTDTDIPTPALWQPAVSVGETGAACAALSIVWAWHAAAKGYLPEGAVLVHATNTEGLRGALVMHSRRT